MRTLRLMIRDVAAPAAPLFSLLRSGRTSRCCWRAHFSRPRGAPWPRPLARQEHQICARVQHLRIR